MTCELRSTTDPQGPAIRREGQPVFAPVQVLLIERVVDEQRRVIADNRFEFVEALDRGGPRTAATTNSVKCDLETFCLEIHHERAVIGILQRVAVIGGS